MLGDIERAVIVITNYHAFKLRETLDITAAGRALLQGRGAPIQTLETEGQMLQRVMPELMGIKNVLVINDEAHHCYRPSRRRPRPTSKTSRVTTRTRRRRTTKPPGCGSVASRP